MPETSVRSPRVPRLVAAVVALVAVVITAPAATAARKPSVKMPVGDLTVYTVGTEPVVLPDDVRDQVMATLKRYTKVATVTPLRKGTADAEALASTLSLAVAARLAGPDRTTLVDEGLPKAVSRIRVRAAPVALTGLADAGGQIVVVTASLDATTKTRTKKGKLTITRTGELEFAPIDGTWKISGYTLTVERVGKGVPDPNAADPNAPPTPGAAEPGAPDEEAAAR